MEGKYPMDKAAYAQKMQAKRQEYYDNYEAALLEVYEQPESFIRYLGVQANLANYSVGNCLMVARQFPIARDVRTKRAWEKMGIQPQPGQKPFSILVPGSKYKRKDGSWAQGFDICDAFDVLQTSAVAQYQKRQQPEPQELIRGLLEYQRGAWSIARTDSGERAYYDTEKQCLCIRRHQLFAPLYEALSKAVAQADTILRFPGAAPQLIDEAAKCISYMLCQRYQINNPISVSPAVLMGDEPKYWRSNLQKHIVEPLRAIIELEEKSFEKGQPEEELE